MDPDASVPFSGLFLTLDEGVDCPLSLQRSDVSYCTTFLVRMGTDALYIHHYMISLQIQVAAGEIKR